MRLILITIPLLFLPFLGWSQTDIPTIKPLKIEAANKLDKKGTPNKGLALKVPSAIKDQPQIKLNLDGRNPVKMLPERKLVQAGTGMIIDPKVGPRENKGKGSSERFGDQYLGDIKNSGEFVGIVCRDHEYVDGDRVKIIVNGVVADPNILLTGAFKGINADLKKGFNRIDFIALNEGSSSPNTAQVDIYDDKGQLIYSNKWLLSSGSKATFIITKE